MGARVKIICTIAGATLALASLGAVAADWSFVGQTDDSKLFVDATSLRPAGKLYKAWFLYNYEKPTQVPINSSLKVASSSKQLYAFDCAHGTYGPLQAVYLSGMNGSGAVVESWTNSYAPELEDVVPDTIGESMLKRVCAGKTGRGSTM
jgi:hypothetical protein